MENYWYWLTGVEGLGYASLRRILDYYQTPEALFQESEAQVVQVLNRICQIKPEVIKRLIQAKSEVFNLPDWQVMEKMGIQMVSLTHPDYPKALLEVHQPPFLLYYQGCLPDVRRTVALVGSRACSPYGAYVAKQLANQLVAKGAQVVSGVARGIDGAAHKGALEAKGYTVGVLGCGLDVTYPREHHPLYEAMKHKGCLISEYPLGTKPLPAFFPMRNRIISGLSRAVVVVEAKAKSGSLITAHQALEQGRDVYAVPGRITDETSNGTHALIQAGAKLVTCVQDILEDWPEYQVHESENIHKNKLPEGLQELYLQLSLEPISVQALAVALSLPVEKVSGSMIQLEILGVARCLADHRYIKA